MATGKVQTNLWGMLKGTFGIAENSSADQSPRRTIKLTTVDAYRLPDNARAIRVIAGGAWVSYNHEDTVLRPGAIMIFDDKADDAVITALGYRTLVLEITEE